METKTMSKVNAAQKSKVRSMAQIGMLSAIAVVLMLFEVPLPFAPAFYEIDFSEMCIRDRHHTMYEGQSEKK